MLFRYLKVTPLRKRHFNSLESRDFYLNQISKGRNNLEDIEDLRDNELVKNEQIDEVVSQIDRDKGYSF